MSRRVVLWAALLGFASVSLVSVWLTADRPVAPPPPPDLTARLTRDVEHLALTLGERNDAHARALSDTADWIEERLAGQGWTVTRESWSVADRPVHNLVVERTGETRPDEVVLFGAHYDSALDSPGANDNATGVAALLELARRARDFRSARSVRFVFFSHGEPPWLRTRKMGSRVHAERAAARGEQIVATVALQSLGYYTDAAGSQGFPEAVPTVVRWLLPKVGDFVAVIGDTSSAGLAREVLDVLEAAGLRCEGGGFPAGLEGVSDGDHAAFWRHGAQAVVVTDTAHFRDDANHGPDDLPGRVDFVQLAQVVEGLDQVLTALAAGG